MCVEVKARSAAVSAVELGHRAAFPKQESRFVFLQTFGPPSTVTDLRYLDPGCSPVGIDGLTVGAAAASSLVGDAPSTAVNFLAARPSSDCLTTFWPETHTTDFPEEPFD